MFKKFAKTIEIDCSPECFVYRTGHEERSLSTHGYILQVTRGNVARGWLPSYRYHQQQKTAKYQPITFFPADGKPPHHDFIPMLSAFLWYGIKPLCGWVRPILLFTRLERFETRDGFEYVIFWEAGKIIALGGKEVYFHTVT